MRKFYTGTDGSLSVDGATIGKVMAWSLDGSAEALSTTTLGDNMPTYRYGRQSYSGSCDVMYYINSNAKFEAAPLVSDIFQTGAVPADKKRRMVLKAGQRSFTFDAVIIEVSTGLVVGGVMKVSIGFLVSGPLIEASLGAP